MGHTFRRGRCVIALEQRNRRHRDAEYHALDHTVDDILAEIHRRTQGIPRLINLVCDNLMLTSFAMESKQASLDMIEEVSRDLHLEWPGGNRIWAGVENTAMQEPRL